MVTIYYSTLKWWGAGMARAPRNLDVTILGWILPGSLVLIAHGREV